MGVYLWLEIYFKFLGILQKKAYPASIDFTSSVSSDSRSQEKTGNNEDKCMGIRCIYDSQTKYKSKKHSNEIKKKE